MNVIRWTAAAALLAATVSGCTGLPGYAGGSGSTAHDTVRADVQPCEMLTSADLATLGLDPSSRKVLGSPVASCLWRSKDPRAVTVGSVGVSAGNLDAVAAAPGLPDVTLSPVAPVAGHRAIELSSGSTATCTMIVELDDHHVLSVVHPLGRCATMAELAVRNLSA